MSQWTDRISNHQVWQTLQDLDVSVGNASSREGIDERAHAALDRIASVSRFVHSRLESADPLLVAPQSLEAVQAALTRVRDEITQFTGNGDLGHLTNANAQADNVVRDLASIPVLVSGNEVRTLGRAAADYRRGLEAVVAEVKQREASLAQNVSALQQRIAELQAAVDKVRTTSETVLSQASNAFQQSQENRQAESARLQSEQESRFLAITADLTAKGTALNTEFAALRQATETRVEGELKAIRDGHAASAQAVLLEIEAHKKRADELLSIIGERGVTSGYQIASRHAMLTKWFWQLMTLVAFGVLIWFAKTVFFADATSEVTWPMLVGRALLTIAIGFAAAYSATQGDKAGAAEAFNRSMALELAALGPFLAPLEASQRDKFRLQVGERTFGQAHGVDATSGTPSPASLAQLLADKDFLEFLKVMRGK